MAGIRLQLRDEIEKRFREAAMRRFGFGRGALSRAAEQAIEAWLSAATETVQFEGDPVKAIEGILSEVSLDAVELQHSVRKLWAGRVVGDAPS